MERRGLDVSRARLDEAAKRNAELIREKPEQLLTLITGEKSVFDGHDVARALRRAINGDLQEFQSTFARVMAAPALLELQPERIDPETGETELARYSRREIVEMEADVQDTEFVRAAVQSLRPTPRVARHLSGSVPIFIRLCVSERFVTSGQLARHWFYGLGCPELQNFFP